MRVIEELKREHRVIEQMLDRVEKVIDPFDLEKVHEALCFFVDFGDKSHHKKEEEVLFPEITRHAMDMAVGPIHVMHKEHDMARAYLRAAREAMPLAADGSSMAQQRVTACVRAYVALLRPHIQKEDKILFALGERTIPPEDDASLLAKFRTVQKLALSDEDYERYSKLASGGASPATPFEREPTEPTAKKARMIDARTLGNDAPSQEELEDTAMNATAGRTIFDNGSHKNYLLHDFGRGLSVQANQFLIVDGEQGMLLDPGGPKVYPNVLAETNMLLGSRKLEYIFLSHQDPDIGTSINAWMLDTDADAYVSKLWMRFLPHYGIDSLLQHRLNAIPDEGMILPLGNSKLHCIPAHFLHSPGNFQLYDATSKVLFTGDLGASVGMDYKVVTDFDGHIQYMRGFHRRYMTSRAAMAAWARMIRGLEIDVIAPQHGAMFRGREMVHQFIDWCEQLECGVDLLGEMRLPV